jgi:hypothetical protein
MKTSALIFAVAALSAGFVASAVAQDTTTPPAKTRAEVKADTKAAAKAGALPNTGDKPNSEGERTTTPKKKKAKKVAPAPDAATSTPK